jgi:hypothetical protein
MRKAKGTSFGILVGLIWIAWSQNLYAQEPRVCSNRALIEAIRIIERACTEFACDFDQLRSLDTRVDKPSLLAALRESDLKPVHLFFPINEDTVTKTFDWPTIKKAQLESIQYASGLHDSMVFVVGRASTIGDIDYNRRLSIRRTQGVLRYLKEDLGIKCRSFHGGYLGEEILQLNSSDARLLNLEPRDYRQDAAILNQSVHVFIFPCPDNL